MYNLLPMKRMITMGFLLVFIAGGVMKLSAQPVIILADSVNLLNIGKQVDLYTDVSSCLPIDSILKPYYQERFFRSASDVPNIGSTKSALWCRFVVNNKSGRQWYLRVDNAYLDTVQVFVKDGNGIIKKELGRDYPYDLREFKSINFVIPLKLARDSLITVYVRAKHYIVHVPLQLGQIRPVVESETNYNLFYGVFFGIVGIMLIMNLIMYFSMRDISLVYYLCYTACFGLYTLITKGFVPLLLPESVLAWNQYSPLIIYCCGFFVPMFGNTFLKAKELSPAFFRINIGSIIFIAITVIIYLAGNRAFASQLIVAWSVAVAVLNLIFGTLIYKNGYKPARFFAIAYSFTIICYIFFSLETAGIFPSTIFSQNSLQFSTIWEIIFFTVAIGDKANILKQDKEKAQTEAITQALRNEQLLHDQNIILEEKVKNRTHELEVEKNKTDDLLLNILPAEIADEIKQFGHSKAKTFSMVTVMFTDFKGFTTISEMVSAELLVNELDYCFSVFDEIIHKHGLEKIKTIGDAYLSAGGLPILNYTHPADTVKAAIEIRDFIAKRKTEKIQKGEIPFEIRIGIHTGPVVAGVVGKKKFVYDIWGDTVNIASRMESSCEVGKINISGTTHNLVKGQFNCFHRGKIQAKNKGEIDMYFVEGFS